jgi:LysM repeat protein
MNHPFFYSSLHIIFIVVLLLCSMAAPVWGASPYKIYTVERCGSRDIVCDPYTVREGDYVWEILRRKGCIVKDDFPGFISILKRLNPHIKNVNRIYPGQRILIPLKRIEPKERPLDGSARYITIPIIPDVLYRTHKVLSGECISRIVTVHTGLRWDQLPKNYVQALKQLNPAIKNMDLIYPGQSIFIPELPAKAPAHTVAATPAPLVLSAAETLPPAEGSTQGWHRVVSKTVALLGGKLLASGQCYFPGKDQDYLALDLAAFPVIELEDGRHLIVQLQEGLSEDLEKRIRSFWEPLVIIRLDPGEPGTAVADRVFRALSCERVRKILNFPELDGGIPVTLRGDWILLQEVDKGKRAQYYCITLIENPQERTSSAVVEYMAKRDIHIVEILVGEGGEYKARLSRESARQDCPMLTIDASDQEAFVSEFVAAMGYSYEPGVPLSFDYAGFRVETTANIIHGGDTPDAVVDFGTFYGDTKLAIEAGGLKVLCVKPDDEPLTIAGNIFELMGVSYTEAPVFFAANRNVFRATSLTIPGLLTLGRKEKMTILTHTSHDAKLVDFLKEKQVRILKIVTSDQ